MGSRYFSRYLRMSVVVVLRRVAVLRLTQYVLVMDIYQPLPAVEHEVVDELFDLREILLHGIFRHLMAHILDAVEQIGISFLPELCCQRTRAEHAEVEQTCLVVGYQPVCTAMKKEGGCGPL